MLEEEVHVVRVGLDERRRLGALGEQDLVGAEQAPAGEDVLEVESEAIIWEPQMVFCDELEICNGRLTSILGG